MSTMVTIPSTYRSPNRHNCGCMGADSVGNKTSSQRQAGKEMCVKHLCKRYDNRFKAPKKERRHDEALVRNLAINIWHKDADRKLRVLGQSTQSQEKVLDTKDLPLRVFSWKYDDFLRRREVSNTVWVDVLLKVENDTGIQMLKFKSDVEELLWYQELLFVALMETRGSTKNERKKYLLNALRRASEFLKIYYTLESEVVKNREQLRQLQAKDKDKNLPKTDPEQNLLRVALEVEFMDTRMYDPIELRYTLRHINSFTNQVDDKSQLFNGRFKKEIDDLKAKMATEKFTSQCALNMFYTEIENFKIQIDDFNARYEKDYDKIENELSYKKLSMEKLGAQKKFFAEQIIRFHEVLEMWRLREIAEAEKKHVEELARMEAEYMKSLKKHHKKGKGKGKGTSK